MGGVIDIILAKCSYIYTSSTVYHTLSRGIQSLDTICSASASMLSCCIPHRSKHRSCTCHTHMCIFHFISICPAIVLAVNRLWWVKLLSLKGLEGYAIPHHGRNYQLFWGRWHPRLADGYYWLLGGGLLLRLLWPLIYCLLGKCHGLYGRLVLSVCCCYCWVLRLYWCITPLPVL